MEYVQKEDLIEFNRELIKRYTGTYFEPDNIKQLQPLEYLLNLCRDNTIFGEEQYPTVEHVAALLLHRMVSGHFFHDGNKRTALQTMRYFLYLNQRRLKATLHPIVVDAQKRQYVPKKLKSTSQGIIVELVEELAQPETYALTYEEVLRFVEHNTLVLHS